MTELTTSSHTYNTKYNLGLRYLRDKTSESDTKAYSLFFELLNENPSDGDIMYIIGSMYEDGLFGPRDMELAIEWYKCGAEYNDTDSCLKLADLLVGDDHKYYIEKALRITLTPTSTFDQTHPATCERIVCDKSVERVSIDLSLLQTYFKQMYPAKETKTIDNETIEALDALIASLEEEPIKKVQEEKVTKVVVTKDTEEIVTSVAYPCAVISMVPHMVTLDTPHEQQLSLPPKKRKGVLKTVWNWILWK
jgi:TPR repeat protein